MMTKLIVKGLVNKTNFIRVVAIIFLAWACYIPEVKLDLKNEYSESGILEAHASRSNSSLRLNGKGFCTSVVMVGCKSGLKNSDELIKIMENKESVEIVFAHDVGNSIEAIYLKRVFAIEAKVNGKPLPHCARGEMLKNIYHPNWFSYLFSVFTFLICLPIIFNFNFYHNLWNSIWEK